MMANLESGITAKLIDRPNDVDFSDVFAYTQEQYEQVLADWAAAHPPEDVNEQYYQDANTAGMVGDAGMTAEQLYGNRDDPNTSEYFQSSGDMNDADFADFSSDPNKMAIPGPYGEPWPLVTRPVELEIGTAIVTIEMEDENAKLPLIWGTNSDKDKQRDVDAAIDTFCEWMKMDWQQIDNLKRDLKKIGEIRPYKAGTPLTVAATPVAEANNRTDPNVVRKGLSRSNRRGRQQSPATPPPQSQQQQTAQSGTVGQLSSVVRLFHSSMIEIEPLAIPYLKTEQRTESVLKYMSRWVRDTGQCKYCAATDT